ncbi:prefoldin subunit 4-like [Raphidocelis subcapitata]|uniref:Prefoldin subunit 4 n=1 Tax=Raphidocelis subcapitata TaxID=307507 RepID=A0A2V0PDS9_9CHLO|nr:prefoldin subunit 4-like [Raphidocelis subcapitata]|eukprot:GBF97669.1 prefoldin subunit 4-like [Raphidocelis subcapitata]
MSKKTEEVQVTWEDQQNINTFSKLNMRRHDLQSLIAAAKKRLEDLDDAGAELVLADDGDGDDGCVRMLVGAAFLHTPKDDAEAEVERAAEEERARLAKLEEEQSGIEARLAELKVILYGRLGSGNINLEE